VIVAVLALGAALVVASALPFAYDFRAYWLAAQHLWTGAPLYEPPGAPLGQPDEFHYLPIVAVPFLALLPLPLDAAAVVWAALEILLAVVVGIALIRPLPNTARPWAVAAYAFFLPNVLEVTLGNIDLLCVGLALVAWHWRTRANAAAVPYAAAVGAKFFPVILIPFYLAAGYVGIVLRAFAVGVAVLVVSLPFLAKPMSDFVALLPRYLDTTWVRLHAEREQPAWLASIIWTDAFSFTLALAAIAAGVVIGLRARRDPAYETDWHHVALALSPYVAPFGFVWTTFLLASLPLFAVTLQRALRLAPWPRAIALVVLVVCWALMQAVQVHEIWPLAAHAAGVFGLVVVAITLIAAEAGQTLGRSTPVARATRIASG
jgi:glycosyl transferase family 87